MKTPVASLLTRCCLLSVLVAYAYPACSAGDDDEGRDGTEIDIIEKPWLDDRVQSTLHWDGYDASHKSKAVLPDRFRVDYVRVYDLGDQQ